MIERTDSDIQFFVGQFVSYAFQKDPVIYYHLFTGNVHKRLVKLGLAVHIGHTFAPDSIYRANDAGFIIWFGYVCNNQNGNNNKPGQQAFYFQFHLFQ